MDVTDGERVVNTRSLTESMMDRKHASSLARTAGAVLAAQVLFGCAVELKKNDWSGYKGPGAEYFQAEELSPF